MGCSPLKDLLATESTEEHGRKNEKKRLKDFLATKSTKEHERLRRTFPLPLRERARERGGAFFRVLSWI
jgi:hypothetical protein